MFGFFNFLVNLAAVERPASPAPTITILPVASEAASASVGIEASAKSAATRGDAPKILSASRRLNFSCFWISFKASSNILSTINFLKKFKFLNSKKKFLQKIGEI